MVYRRKYGRKRRSYGRKYTSKRSYGRKYGASRSIYRGRRRGRQAPRRFRIGRSSTASSRRFGSLVGKLGGRDSSGAIKQGVLAGVKRKLSEMLEQARASQLAEIDDVARNPRDMMSDLQSMWNTLQGTNAQIGSAPSPMLEL